MQGPATEGRTLASNIEIKASLGYRACSVHALAAAVSATRPVSIEQKDTFFNVRHGRLKLREFGEDTSEAGVGADAPGAGAAELIFYERPDTEEPTASSYSLVAVPDPAALKAALTAAIGVRGVVSKRRTLYLAGETRIHIDEVDGLGTFLELEVVLGTGAGAASHEEGVARCRELMSTLGIDEQDLIDRAYVDLLEEV